MYTVFVEGIQAYAFHGVSDEEQKLGHRYEIDLEMEIEGIADATDRIEDTVDYGVISMAVLELVRSGQFRTVERLARFIGDSLLQNHPRIKSVEIAIRKLLPPADVIVEATGVVLRVERGS